jgi:D-alanyl-D-alanine carboxypeptidase/D-alanyl-D-alanine-endopeptidase (penicillin-binding protein 4)
VVREWFSAKGIATDGLVLDNGSGLSRSERITPQQMVDVLNAARRAVHWPDLWASLPLVGVDGTMSRRMKGSAAEGRARLKSGTLKNAVAVAGYVLDQNDQPWVVVAMVNHDAASAKGRPVLDSIVEWVASQK